MGMLANNKKRIPTPEEVEKFINSGGQQAEEAAVPVQPVPQEQPQAVQQVQPAVQQAPQPQPVVQPVAQQYVQQPVPQQVVIQQPVMAAAPQQYYAVQAAVPAAQAEPMRNFHLRLPVSYHKALKRHLIDEEGHVSMNSYLLEAITEKLKRDGLI